MAIAWNEDLKMGVTIIDEQHQSLFMIVNKLEKFEGTRECFKEILVELQTYVSMHFSTEEEYMLYMNYPDYQKHKACHEKFITDYKLTLKNALGTENTASIAASLFTLTETWIKDHYPSEDMRLANFIKNNASRCPS